MRGIRKLGMGAVCLLLVCLLALTAYAAPADNCPGSCSHQAAIGTTHYDTLGEAIAAAQENATVTLLTDISTESMLTVAKPITLDLGGKTLTGSLLSPSQTAVRFTADTTVRGGTIAAVNGTALQAVGCTLVLEKDVAITGSGNAPALVLEASEAKVSGSITNKGSYPAIYSAPAQDEGCSLYILENARISTQTHTAVELHSPGKLEVSGGTVQAKNDSIQVHIYGDQSMELSVTGGTILSQEGQAVVVTTHDGAKAPEAFITGGTFSTVPQTYVPAHGKVTENEDGTFTLVTQYTVTFHANGASGTMAPVKVNCGSPITLPACGFTSPADKDFAGWQIGGTVCQSGDSYTPTGDIAATALWKTHTHTGGKATCQEKATCKVCGESYGKLADHDLNFIAAYAPSCTASGMNAHSLCSICGGRFVDGVKISASALTIPAMGHEWQNVEGVAATCETQGLRSYKQCENCGDLRLEGSTVSREELIIPATGHVLVNVPAVQATCSEAGTQAHEYCSGCGQHFLNGLVADESALTTALASHLLSDWQGDESYHWKSCVDCGAVFRLNNHVDADLSGSCDDCNAPVEAEKTETPAKTGGFGWLWLLPLVIALVIVILLLLKKRKANQT